MDAINKFFIKRSYWLQIEIRCNIMSRNEELKWMNWSITFHRFRQAPDDTDIVSSGVFCIMKKFFLNAKRIANVRFTHRCPGKESLAMVKINGEEKQLDGRNLLEYLKEARFEP